MSIKLSVLYEDNYALIITKNNNNFKVYIIKAKELIK